jgi:hypothetical protein
MAVPIYRNMTPYGLVHNCYRSVQAVHVFRVARRDLDQFTRRHAVNSSDTAVAVWSRVPDSWNLRCNFVPEQIIEKDFVYSKSEMAAQAQDGGQTARRAHVTHTKPEQLRKKAYSKLYQ